MKKRGDIKTKKKGSGLFWIGIILLFFGSVSLGYVLRDHDIFNEDAIRWSSGNFRLPIEVRYNESSMTRDSVLEECRNQSIFDTSTCLRNHIVLIFNYTVREDTIKTFEDIKKNGGDCYDYNLLYTSMAISLGFNATNTYLYSQIRGHVYSTIFSDDGYCNLDLTNLPECHKYVPLDANETRKK